MSQLYFFIPLHEFFVVFVLYPTIVLISLNIPLKFYFVVSIVPQSSSHRLTFDVKHLLFFFTIQLLFKILIYCTFMFGIRATTIVTGFLIIVILIGLKTYQIFSLIF
jgi:hypothetical protein